MIDLILYINIFIIWYFLAVNLGYLLLLLVSIPEVLARFKESESGNIELFVNNKMTPTICVLVPGYNEEHDIISTIESLLKSDYPNLEILVINDGSSDKTMEVLALRYQLAQVYPEYTPRIKTRAIKAKHYISRSYPNLQILDKEHSGKADSLNMGINVLTASLFMSVDADTLLEPNTISTLAYAMLSQPHTVAEGGAIYVLNGCNYKNGELIEAKMSFSPIVALQSSEYLRAYVFGRTGWNALRGPLVLSGALTLLEQKAVIDIGGFKLDSPGEDMEIIVHLHEYMRENKYPYRIGHTISAAAWTHVPTDMNTLWSQRDRWHRGLMDSLFSHKKMMLNTKFGATGLFTYPFQFFAEFLGPIVEFIGYITLALAMALDVVNWQFAVLFFLASWGFSSIITMGATLISIISFNKYKQTTDIIFILLLSVVENCGYRPIIAMCRFVSSIEYLIKKRQ